MISCSDFSDTNWKSVLSPTIYSGEVMVIPIPRMESGSLNQEIELFRKTLEFIASATAESNADKNGKTQNSIRESAAAFRAKLLANLFYWYTSKQACEVEDLGAANPSGHLADRRERLEVFGVQKGREWLYPRFQWSETEGRPFRCIKEILEIEPAVSRWFLIRWFETPSPLLGGKRPVELVSVSSRWKHLVNAAEKNLEEAPVDSNSRS